MSNPMNSSSCTPQLETENTTTLLGRAAISVVPESETLLVRLARDGDKNAYWRLVEPHLRAMFLTAQSILRNFADADEVSQEALLKAMRNIRGFRGESRIKTWLVQITVNESLIRLRKYRKHLYRPLEQEADSDSDQPNHFTDHCEIPSEALARKELRNALQSAIGSLPLAYREVLALRYIAELSNKETAQVLGLTLSNVKIRLLRARRKMRELLEPHLDASWFGTNWCGRKTPANCLTDDTPENRQGALKHRRGHIDFSAFHSHGTSQSPESLDEIRRTIVTVPRNYFPEL